MIPFLKCGALGFIILGSSLASAASPCVDFSGTWIGGCQGFGLMLGMSLKQQGCEGIHEQKYFNRYFEFGQPLQFVDESSRTDVSTLISWAQSRTVVHVNATAKSRPHAEEEVFATLDADFKIKDGQLLITGTGDGKPLNCVLQNFGS